MPSGRNRYAPSKPSTWTQDLNARPEPPCGPGRPGRFPERRGFHHRPACRGRFYREKATNPSDAVGVSTGLRPFRLYRSWRFGAW